MDRPEVLPEGIWIAVDFGTSQMGVAVGNSVVYSVSPLKPLRVSSFSKAKEDLLALLNHWQAVGCVFGWPLKTDGSPLWVVEPLLEFSASLRDQYHGLILYQDERYSTVEAKFHLFEKGGRKALDKASVDSFSAVLILEDFFSSRGPSVL